MDKAGRVILSKPVRDRLGLHEGSDLEVVETPEGVMLKPVEDRPSMIKKQGLWVHTGKVLPASMSSRPSATTVKTESESCRDCESLR